jgi:hypothetical protein
MDIQILTIHRPQKLQLPSINPCMLRKYVDEFCDTYQPIVVVIMRDSLMTTTRAMCVSLVSFSQTATSIPNI